MRLGLLFNPRLLILLFMLLVLAQAMPAGGQDLVEVGSMPYGPCYAAALNNSRNVAFFGNGSVLQAVDLSYPYEPVLVGELRLPGAVHDMFFSAGGGDEDRLYVANGHGGLRIVTMEYKTEAEVVTEVKFTEIGSVVAGLKDARQLEIVNNRAYIANGRYGLAVVDVYDAPQPVLLGTYSSIPGETLEVAYHPASGRAIVAAGASGLFIIDVNDPTNMQEVSLPSDATPITATDVSSVALAGNLLYILDRTAGLSVVNMADADYPEQYHQQDTDVLYFDTGGDKVSVTVLNEGSLNGTAFVADGSVGLSVIDVNDPEALSLVAVDRDTDGLIYHLATAGYATKVYATPYADEDNLNTILVADDKGGLRIVGKAEGTSYPWEMSYYDTPGLACGIAISGEVAYIADGDGVRVYDISNPLAFPELGMVAMVKDFQGIAASGNYAYVAAPDGLHRVDATKPASITTTPIFTKASPARKVSIFNNILSVTSGDPDTDPGIMLYTISVEDPDKVQQLGPGSVTEMGVNLAMDKSRTYVAGSNALYAQEYKNLPSASLLPIFSLNSPTKVAVSEGYAYVTDADGLCVLSVVDNVGTPTARMVSRWPDPLSLTTVAVTNAPVTDPDAPTVSYSAVYAVGDNALHVFNVERVKQDGEEVFTLTELDPIILPLDKDGDILATSNNRVYVIAGAAGVRIYGVDRDAPVANAGSDISIFSGFTAYLPAKASTDDVAIVKYNWKSLNSSIELSAADTAEARFITPKVSQPTTYEFELTVEDGAGRSSSDTVVVTVNPYTGRGKSDGESSGCTMNPEAGFRIEWLFLAGLLALLRLRRRKR